MLVLVSYDVATSDAHGMRRLRRVAKICQEYGQRVQNSVFECLVEPAQFEMLKARLRKEADLGRDSLRFYNLGSYSKRRIEHMGVKESYDPEGPLVI